MSRQMRAYRGVRPRRNSRYGTPLESTSVALSAIGMSVMPPISSTVDPVTATGTAASLVRDLRGARPVATMGPRAPPSPYLHAGRVPLRRLRGAGRLHPDRVHGCGGAADRLRPRLPRVA